MSDSPLTSVYVFRVCQNPVDLRGTDCLIEGNVSMLTKIWQLERSVHTSLFLLTGTKKGEKQSLENLTEHAQRFLWPESEEPNRTCSEGPVARV